ncbi:type IV pilus modification protein PilV [Neisseria sp. ZJ106]|uniref:Type IV pilus modification protein PilV n=1 Tax=Neisseria lisongii TaxID=2912188 RepID=A0ABY7RL07_9NEIS|nr:type IV pilus modification protein PilV [Neisseria lisongii]MCF7521435.1 type IV pilus modification protein PilV [Neisseria lisongii]WCL72314.1 type IV pilus modification protein PilV [Neisseria lisongii]
MSNPPTSRLQGRLKTGIANPKIHGNTLPEVLVAMLILSIGILAFLSDQTRSVQTVRTAEQHSAVAQILQNLSENIAANPLMIQDKNSGRLLKSHVLYHRNAQKVRPCHAATHTAADSGTLAEIHLCRFQQELAAALPDTEIYFSICADSAGIPPDIQNGVFNDFCDRRTGLSAVKIAWQPANTQNVYSHQALIAE